MSGAREEGFYWVRVANDIGDGWQPAAWRQGMWWILCWEPCLDDSDMIAIGPRIEPPAP